MSNIISVVFMMYLRSNDGSAGLACHSVPIDS